MIKQKTRIRATHQLASSKPLTKSQPIQGTGRIIERDGKKVRVTYEKIIGNVTFLSYEPVQEEILRPNPIKQSQNRSPKKVNPIERARYSSYGGL